MTGLEIKKHCLAALAAAKNAYAPYSGFSVGAALLCKDGRVFLGANVENASYSLTNCAERTAVFAAVAAGCRDFSAIFIACFTENPCIPCGACLQVLSEFCPPGFPVYAVSQTGEYTLYRLADLLPVRFLLEKPQQMPSNKH